MSWTHRPLLASATALCLLALAPSAGAQSVLHRHDFEGQAQGWQTHGLWDLDGSPSAAPGGAAASGARSLNFNNGQDYAGQSRGAAASPAISVPAGEGLELRFRCNYETETTGTRWDTRSVLIKLNGSVQQTLQLASTSSTPRPQRCAAMGTWHQHVVAFPTHSAAREVQVEFVFNSVDAYGNAHAGWFVDDFELVWPNAPAPQAFRTIRNSSRDFRQYTVAVEVLADKSVAVYQSSPTARYMPVTGTATEAEFRALSEAVQRGQLASVPSLIPDPNVYIVAPTGFQLELDANLSGARSIEGSLGVYGTWDAQLRPVVDALLAIQTRLLSAPAPAGDDHGDEAASASPIDLHDPSDPNAPAVKGAIDPPGDVDVFVAAEVVPMIAVFPAPLSDYTFETRVVGAMDTYLELYAADGTLLASDDDSGQGLASKLTYRGVRGVPLYAKVRHYSATGTGSYTIRATRAPVAPPAPQPKDDHGSTPATATLIDFGGAPLAGTIESAGDEDLFQLSQVVIAIYPPPVFTYVVETTVTGSMDTVIELIGPDGTTLIASNDDAPGLGTASRIELTAPAGTFAYVRVRHYSKTGTGSYTLEISSK